MEKKKRFGASGHNLCDTSICVPSYCVANKSGISEQLEGGEAGCGIAVGLTHCLICGQPRDDFMISELRMDMILDSNID